MYALVVSCLLVAQVFAGYVGDHGSYHGPEARPVVKPDGFLADTHDVAAAKNLHLGALSQAAAHSGSYDGHGSDHGVHHSDAHHGGDHGVHHGDAPVGYHGPHAVPKVLPDGHIADTHEVAAAKGAHYTAILKAKANNPGGDYHGQYVDTHHGDSTHDAYHGDTTHGAYHGPIAKPVVLPSGHLADTHEVAAAKGAHLGALAHAHHH